MSSEPSAQLAHQEPSAIRWRVIILAFLALLLDGFDTAALAFAVPTLATAWETVPAAFTLPLVLTNAGVVVGYLTCGWLGARLGRRRVLIGGVVLYGLGAIAAALVIPLESIAILSVVRLITGLGLGVVLPIAVSLSTSHSPVRRREAVSVAVTLGLPSGLTLGGFTGGALIQSVGVTGVFSVGCCRWRWRSSWCGG
ncbi:MFS transporter [Pseudonocardia nigra]|uniref:MFS transporter n=1 Tax=Pseudonocardia nigra TaxID=1921578 RepID=UPI001C5DFCD2|nr:MFS transporter [Pseudonocardia nigra]